MKRHIIRILSTIMICALMSTVANAAYCGAGAAMVPDDQCPEVYLPTMDTRGEDATLATVDMLRSLAYKLNDVYYLEARVKTLQTYNTFKDGEGSFGGYFTFSNDTTTPKSIYSQLDEDVQQQIRQLSTYQAFLLIMKTDLYQCDTDFRAQVDQEYDTFINFMPLYVRKSLVGFVPYAVTEQLNPDQLCILGELIVSSPAYKDLKDALSPAVNLGMSIEVFLNPAQISDQYNEITQAAFRLWPQGSVELSLWRGIKPNNATTLVPIPDTSVGS